MEELPTPHYSATPALEDDWKVRQWRVHSGNCSPGEVTGQAFSAVSQLGRLVHLGYESPGKSPHAS
jgi:hypothetical protein